MGLTLAAWLFLVRQIAINSRPMVKKGHSYDFDKLFEGNECNP